MKCHELKNFSDGRIFICLMSNESHAQHNKSMLNNPSTQELSDLLDILVLLMLLMLMFLILKIEWL